jgi:hypothetical protein
MDKPPDSSTESTQPIQRRQRLISARLSILLIGAVAIGLIILMCVAVLLLAYYKA